MIDSNLATMADIAAVACSGASVEERICEVIECLRALIPIDGATVSHVDPTTGRSQMLVNAGYAPHIAEHVSGPDYHAEVVAPWALPLGGWPIRERDIAVDPLSLRCNVEYFRPAGLVEGLSSALVTRDGRFVGALDVGVSDRRHPSDEACSVIGHLAPMLANLLDPLQSAATVAALLGGRACTAIGVLPDGRAMVLRGEPCDELLGPAARIAADDGTGGGAGVDAFLWPRAGGGWHGCHVLRCRDGVAVLVVSEEIDVHELTPRELEVLSCLVDGLSNAEIARRLWIAVRTARAHVEHILTKLEVSTRSAAVALAVREGLLLPQPR
jgi:DNA-binding CsgD family transcriptional regulator